MHLEWLSNNINSNKSKQKKAIRRLNLSTAKIEDLNIMIFKRGNHFDFKIEIWSTRVNFYESMPKVLIPQTMKGVNAGFLSTMFYIFNCHINMRFLIQLYEIYFHKFSCSQVLLCSMSLKLMIQMAKCFYICDATDSIISVNKNHGSINKICIKNSTSMSGITMSAKYFC